MSKEMIYPFILCGGSGSRLWPLSRRSFPKQFLSLVSKNSLLQDTCIRLQHQNLAPPVILAGDEHRFLVAEQLRQININPECIVLEPIGRNTAPAAAISALLGSKTDSDALVLLLPSDQVIIDAEKFLGSLFEGLEAAKNGYIVTFGVKPSRPETGYGYIEAEAENGVIRGVKRFIEKPSFEVAEQLTADKNYFWNAGIFLFSVKTMISAFEEFAPQIIEACKEALAIAKHDLDFLRLDSDAYSKSESISLDYAIMEKAKRIKTVCLQSDWSDLGTWPAIWSIHEKDESGNVSRGDVLLLDTSNSYVHSEDGLQLSLIGLDDVLAIATKDAIVVAAKDRAQDIKHIVSNLKEQNRSEVDFHKRVYRPWGWYEQLGQGDRYQVKCIMVKPGAKLSLQSHHHRAEHWVVVKGTLEVTISDNVKLLTENQSVYVPLGEVHRLANPGIVPAFLVEVQSGAYLGEDDIVRYEDIYGRDDAD